MHNSEPATIASSRPTSPARLELVAGGTTRQPSSQSDAVQKQPEHVAPDRFGWAMLNSFGPVGNAFHASDYSTHTPASSLDTQQSHASASPGSLLLPSIGTKIVGGYRRWRRQREIRAQIAYLKNLPDWVLRDIGLQRDQIEYAASLEHHGVILGQFAE